MRKKILILLIISIVLVLLFFFFRRNPAHRPFGLNNLNPSLNSLSDFFNKKVPFNVLLLGYAGGNHDGIYLTDSMIVAQVDPAKKTVSLISLPRDLWVKIPTRGKEGGDWKINAAYALGMDDNAYPNKDAAFKGKEGPGNLAKYVVEEVTGLSIDRFVAVDFSGFKKTIDTLGGLDVKVEKTFDDFEYPIDGRENDLCGHTSEDLPDLEKAATLSANGAFPCRFEHLHFDAGVVHMDGAMALKFVRSRHSLQDGSDFGRSVRQKNVILAAKNKVLSLGFVPKIPGFIAALSGSYNTDLNPKDIAGLLGQSGVAGDYQIKSLALTTDNFLKATFADDGQYVLISQAGVDNWLPLQKGIAAFLHPETRLSSPFIKIENTTFIGDLGDLAQNRLSQLGFTVLPIDLTSVGQKKNLEKTAITVLNKGIEPKVIRQLQNEFETEAVVYGPEPNPDYDVLISVGQDYQAKHK